MNLIMHTAVNFQFAEHALQILMPLFCFLHCDGTPGRDHWYKRLVGSVSICHIVQLKAAQSVLESGRTCPSSRKLLE